MEVSEYFCPLSVYSLKIINISKINNMRLKHVCKHNIIGTDAPSIRLTFPVVKVHVTDFPVVKIHVELSSAARIWQHKLCATLSANVYINNRPPIKVYYCMCTVRNIRIEIINGKQNVL